MATTTTTKRRMRKPDRLAYFARVMRPCKNEGELLAWLELYCGLIVPTKSVCPHHSAPFDYVKAAYFEPAADLLVWAPRGGGKTRLAAAATLLDLLHKPGVSVRLLGGSLLQSMRMWEHLEPDLGECVKELLIRHRPGQHEVRTADGSSAAVLTQSQRAVRGLRVQKLRCDELELFDREVWEAAQLVTRSKTLKDGMVVRASIEALSTFHRPYGLMADLVDQVMHGAKPSPGARLVHWCILDVLEHCPPQRDCNGCDLYADCKGAAKSETVNGFFAIDDAIAIKRRSSVETWEAEMLCLRPSQKGCVFRTFDQRVHVFDDDDELASPASAGGSSRLDGTRLDERTDPPAEAGGSSRLDQRTDPPAEAGSPITLALDFGYAAPFVCLWIAGGPAGSVYVLDEYVQAQRTMDEHLAQIEGRRWGTVRRVACDPAGSAHNEHTAASNVQLLRCRGYVVKTRGSRIVDGLEMIRAALKPAAGEPTLFIHARCARLIKALRSYHYAEGGSELPVKDGDHDHLIDALRYWFVNRGGAAARTRLY